MSRALWIGFLAVEGVKKVYHEMLVIKAVATVKDFKGVTSVTSRVKVRPEG